MEPSQDNEIHELDLFQTHIADRLGLLLSNLQEAPYDPRPDKKNKKTQFLLNMTFIYNLLDAFLVFDDEFRALLSLIVSQNPNVVTKPPVDRLISDHLDRCIKSLDICNAVTQSLDNLYHANKHAAVAVDVIRGNSHTYSPHEAQFNRGKNAITKLILAISEKSPTENDRSLDRRQSTKNGIQGGSTTTSTTSGSVKRNNRSLSLAVSKNWSAAKQLNAMSANLHPPRGGECSAPALTIYAMSSVQVFVMWVLVSAFPSQERTQAPVFPTPPKQTPWAASVMGMQEKILEEWKKREKKAAAAMMPSGMMLELQGLERCGKRLIELMEGASFPLNEDNIVVEITTETKEMADLCQMVEEDIDPLSRKIREVFHRIVKSRSDVHEITVQGTKASSCSAAI